ncbi:uncharacterized protein CCR75_003286 [Bremia lactucae]|uniref:Uncharacterized protein n=1 Tax=Bremia lactucae TaxID=4779 RepID=A0A976NYF6_BRELC|nr:hypothetical protein CCR75_003286 [Bremia lactucae]
MSFSILKVAFVAGALLIATNALTYPACAPNGKKCCEYGTGKMKHHGYIAIIENKEHLTVTCSNGTLLCCLEDPIKTASFDPAETIDCPDFRKMMEDGTEIIYVEGVEESGAGTVKPAASVS